jgi:4-amino-4-deoxy-L-arabinose transferase-like glycosyltransferase
VSIERTLLRDFANAATITAIFVAFQLTASLAAGTLSLPPTYDDVSYYVDAASRVQTFWQGNVLDVLRGYIAIPPHAPGSTLLATIGFLLFGIKPWAADLANALPLFVFVLVLMRLFSGLPIGVKLAATIASLSIPIFGLAIVEFRPDMWCAGFTVLGTLLIALRDPRESRTAIAAGASFAAALLMKPAFSPLVIILFGLSLVLRLAPSLRETKQSKAAVLACVTIGGVAVVLAGPHYILSLDHIIDYYRIHVFGPTVAVWSPSLSTTQTALYYITGEATLSSLGRWVYVGMATLVTPLILLTRSRERAWQATILVILALTSYVVVTVAPNKGSYLGLIFMAYVAGAIIVCAALVLHALHKRQLDTATYVTAGALLLFAASVYQLPWLLLHGGSVYPADVTAARHQVLAEIVSVLQSDRDIGSKKIMILPIGFYLNDDMLQFSFIRQLRKPPIFISQYFSSDQSAQLETMRQADYVITLSVDYPDAVPYLPNSKMASVATALNHREGFDLARVIRPSSGEPGEISIYRRISR